LKPERSWFFYRIAPLTEGTSLRYPHGAFWFSFKQSHNHQPKKTLFSENKRIDIVFVVVVANS
jgi:hypothetical protein